MASSGNSFEFHLFTLSELINSLIFCLSVISAIVSDSPDCVTSIFSVLSKLSSQFSSLHPIKIKDTLTNNKKNIKTLLISNALPFFYSLSCLYTLFYVATPLYGIQYISFYGINL